MKKIQLMVLALFLILAAFISPLSAEETEPLRYIIEEAIGEVSVVSSDPAVTRVGRIGASVEAGQEIRVGSGGEAVLFLNEDTSIRLSENSQMVVAELTASEKGGFLNRLKLLGGRILSEVKNLSKSGSRFEVESGGVVCGVRGTAFEVARVGDGVETATYDGEVEVRSGDAVEKMKAGYRFAFLKQRAHMKRKLDRVEKERFKKWQKQRQLLREKHKKRVRTLQLQHRRSIQKKVQLDRLKKQRQQKK